MQPSKTTWAVALVTASTILIGTFSRTTTEVDGGKEKSTIKIATIRIAQQYSKKAIKNARYT